MFIAFAYLSTGLFESFDIYKNSVFISWLRQAFCSSKEVFQKIEGCVKAVMRYFNVDVQQNKE
jgi:hypothetical protein